MRLTGLLLVIMFSLSALTSEAAIDRERLRWLNDKPKVDSISIFGNSYFSNGEVKKAMYSHRRSLLNALKGDRRSRIQRESYGRDTLGIKYLYLTNGFLNIKLNIQVRPLPPDSGAIIAVSVIEGRQYYYGKISLAGSFEAEFTDDLRRVAEKLKGGKPISELQLRQSTFDMKTVLANNGYPYATVSYQLGDPDADAKMSVTFQISGEALVHFGEVEIEGTERYPEYAARREVRIKAGEIYRRKTIIESNRRLIESGYFRTFNLKQRDQIADRLRPDFTLTVRERKPVYVTVETGAGQSEEKDLQWRFSSGFGKRNFLGSRRYDLLSELVFGLGSDSRLINHNYRIRFTEPWLLGLRMPLALTAKWEPGVKDPVQNYRIESYSFSAVTTRRFGERTYANLGVQWEKVNIFGVPIEEIDLRKDELGITVRRKLHASFRSDLRDNVFVPKRGTMVDLSVEYFGGRLGGDWSFSKVGAGVSYYKVVWPGWVMASRVRGGWVQEFGETQSVPVDERLLLGGANTVRGFRESHLGPLREDGSPDGAIVTTVFNQEFRWKTLQIFQVMPLLKDLFARMPLWQSVFFDAGNGFRRTHHFRWDKLAYTYGTGVQIISPAGPIRLDYARIIPTDAFDFDERWHFTILYAF